MCGWGCSIHAHSSNSLLLFIWVSQQCTTGSVEGYRAPHFPRILRDGRFSVPFPISLVEPHRRDGVSAAVSQNHGRYLIKKAIYGGKIRWNRPASVDAKWRESDGVVFADRHDRIGDIRTRFGNEKRIAVTLEALADIVKVLEVKIGRKDAIRYWCQRFPK